MTDQRKPPPSAPPQLRIVREDDRRLVPLRREPSHYNIFAIIVRNVETGEESNVYEVDHATGQTTAFTSSDYGWIAARFDKAKNFAEMSGQIAMLRTYRLIFTREI